MSLETSLLEKQIDVRDGLDPRERRALTEFLKDRANAERVGDELKKNPDFSKVLGALWEGATKNVDRRLDSIKDLAANGSDELLRAAQDANGTELESLFAAMGALREAGVDVSAAEANLRALARKFVEISTAENMGAHASGEYTVTKRATVMASGGPREVTGREKRNGNPGLEASLRLTDTVIDAGTPQQALKWLRDTYARIGQDSWRDNADAKAYAALVEKMRGRTMEKMMEEGDRAGLVEFARLVTGRDPQVKVESGMRDARLARTALVAAMGMGETDGRGREKRSLLDRYGAEIKDKAVDAMGGNRGVVDSFREAFGDQARDVMKQLGCPNAADLAGMDFATMPPGEQVKMSILARFAAEIRAKTGAISAQLEGAAAALPAGKTPEGPAEEGAAAYRAMGPERRRAEAARFALASVAARGGEIIKDAQENLAEAVKASTAALGKILDSRVSAFGNLEEGLAISAAERETLQLFIDVEGVGALNFSDEGAAKLREYAKTAAVIAVAIGASVATGGLAAGPIAAAMISAGAGAAAATGAGVALKMAEGEAVVKEDVLTDAAMNTVLGVVGGAATAKLLSAAGKAAMAARLAATKGVSPEAAKQMVGRLADIVAKGTAKGATEAEKALAAAEAKAFEKAFGASLADLAEAGAVKAAKLATGVGAGAAEAGLGMFAESARQQLVLGEDASFIDMVKSGGLLAAISLAAGHAGAARELRAGSGAKPARVAEHTQHQAASLDATPVDGHAVFVEPRAARAQPAFDPDATILPTNRTPEEIRAREEIKNLAEAKSVLQEAAKDAPADQKSVLERREKMVDEASADARTRLSYEERKAAHLAKPKPLSLEEAIAREKAAKEADASRAANPTPKAESAPRGYRGPNEASRPFARGKVPAETVEANGSLDDAGRTAKAAEYLGKDLDAAQKDAVLKAHYVGEAGEGAYTPQEIAGKADVLRREGGFSPEESRVLMETGVTGTWSRMRATVERLFSSAPEAAPRQAEAPAARPTLDGSETPIPRERTGADRTQVIDTERVPRESLREISAEERKAVRAELGQVMADMNYNSLHQSLDMVDYARQHGLPLVRAQREVDFGARMDSIAAGGARLTEGSNCVGMSRELARRLNERGIPAHVAVFDGNGHAAAIVPGTIDGRRTYTILDPGLGVHEPIVVPEGGSSKPIVYGKYRTTASCDAQGRITMVTEANIAPRGAPPEYSTGREAGGSRRTVDATVAHHNPEDVVNRTVLALQSDVAQVQRLDRDGRTLAMVRINREERGSEPLIGIKVRGEVAAGAYGTEIRGVTFGRLAEAKAANDQTWKSFCAASEALGYHPDRLYADIQRWRQDWVARVDRDGGLSETLSNSNP